MKLKPILFIAGLLLSTGLLAQDPNLYIYLCFGQSNMEGMGTVQQQDKTVDSRFKVLQPLNCAGIGAKGQWRTAVPPLCNCWSGLTPADYFGRIMVGNLPDSISVGVINVAVGGCDIRLFDKDLYGKYDSTYTESWFTDKIKAYQGNPYAYFIEMAKLAQQAGVVKGILLHQGETNTGDSNWPNYVKTIYNNMLTDLSLDANEVPLLAGQVVHQDQGGICASMNTIIDKLPNTIATAHVISSSGCTAQSDNVHFNSAGYREIGKRYATKMLSLMGIDDVDLNPVAVSLVLDDIMHNGYALSQNYPNPISSVTIISFEIPKDSEVSLKVYNPQGLEVVELAGKKYAAGKHTVSFEPHKLPAGLYSYAIKTGEFSITRKMLIAPK